MDANTLCLSALSLGEASGYELRKRFEEAFNHFQTAGYGSIYPALARLQREGAVVCREEQATGRRARKVYRLTPQGRSRLIEALLETEPSEHCRSDFVGLVFLAHLLPPEHLAGAIGAQIANLESELISLRAISEREGLTSGMRFSLAYGIAAKQARLDFVRREGARFIEALREERENADA
jgi:DNA-binding PadR family transcriptional regulator